jgi:hypothetical protein
MNKRLIAAAAILFIFLSSSAFQSGQAAQPARALFQETAYPIESPTAEQQPTGYDGPETPTLDYPYPADPTTTAAPRNPTATLAPGTTATAKAPNPTASITATAGPSPTAGRNLFSTEDAEIKNARVTARVTETAVPSRTSQRSATALPSPSPTPSPAFVFDNYWFLAGLLIPLGLLFAAWFIFRLKNSGEFKV